MKEEVLHTICREMIQLVTLTDQPAIQWQHTMRF